MKEIEKEGKNAPPGSDLLLDWNGARPPESTELKGRYVRLQPLDAERDSEALWRAFAQDADGKDWTWLPYGPFEDPDAFHRWLSGLQGQQDPLFMTLRSTQAGAGLGLGMAAWMRCQPAQGVIEIGHIHLAPALQRSRAATEALYLMMRRVFDDWGYRRLEWKCDALNAPSRRAAERLGFRFEGIFRQHLVVKGRNRDTAWYSVIDREWPQLRLAFGQWLDEANFDDKGHQKRSLVAMRAALENNRKTP